MRENTSFLDGSLSAGNPLKNTDSALLHFKTLNIHQISRRLAMLGNQDGGSFFLDF